MATSGPGDAIGPRDPVTALPGIGPERAAALAAAGIRTVFDLLKNLPRRHSTRLPLVSIASLREGDSAAVRGRLASVRTKSGFRGRRGRVNAVLAPLGPTAHPAAGAGGRLLVTFFNASWLGKKLRRGLAIEVRGRVSRYRGELQMANPDFDLLPEDSEPFLEAAPQEAALGSGPVYATPSGFGPRRYGALVRSALDLVRGRLRDPLPDAVRGDLLPLGAAFEAIHEKTAEAAAEAGRRRLAFDELLALSLSIALARVSRAGERTRRPIAIDSRLDARIRARFPFAPTAAQERAIADIARDLAGAAPMNRLLQGDVGSGKTAVAAYAVLAAVGNRRQAVVMAPTEVLAEQHHRTFGAWLAGSRVRTALLAGGLGARERAARAAEADIVIGTHALLEGDVAFPRLGLAVIDEQQKFGVAERHRLRLKGEAPDVLVMTATPIPRTLALTVYGDLDVSVIDELPPGRVPIRTRVIGEDGRERAIADLRADLDAGRRAYVVYPLVEDSEALDLRSATRGYEALSSGPLRGVPVGLLHGRLPSEEKESVLARFRDGRLRALVSTVVIEVGVDVKEATVMVVEEAHRFGLAQLHQLRGRVGRGFEPGRCDLVCGRKAGRDGRQRLAILARTLDGFRIAEEDLKMRGPGELGGFRQHGLPDLVVADPVADLDLLTRARDVAFRAARADAAAAARLRAELLSSAAAEPLADAARRQLVRVG